MFPSDKETFAAWDDLFKPTRALDGETARALDYAEQMAEAAQELRRRQDAVDRAKADLERKREMRRTAEEARQARYGRPC